MSATWNTRSGPSGFRAALRQLRDYRLVGKIAGGIALPD